MRRQLLLAAASRSCCLPAQQQHARGTARRAAATAASPPPAVQAALLLIGDEILRGSVTDANMPWLAGLLHRQGVDLTRVEVVPDRVEDIVEAVTRLRRRVGLDQQGGGFVFTSGGIGPTHDDVTYEALAQAFGVELRLHAPTVELMREHYSQRGLELNEARLRMATLPHPAEVLVTPGTWVPLVNLQGVYVLPGIPRLFTQLLTAHQHRFVGGAPPLSRELYSALGESFIATALTAVSKQHPLVQIGSYPNVVNDQDAEAAGWRTRLAFTSRDAQALAAALAAAREAMPHLSEEAPQPRKERHGT